MRRLLAAAVVALLLTVVPPAAQAGSSTDIALGLASFAIFNQVIGPLALPQPAAFHHHRVVYTQTVVAAPPVVYSAPVVYAPAVAAPAPYPTVVQYPHGRYELQVVGGQYVWLWIPNVLPVAPPPPPPA